MTVTVTVTSASRFLLALAPSSMLALPSACAGVHASISEG